jgi:Flp pilus assembly protein TadD
MLAYELAHEPFLNELGYEWMRAQRLELASAVLALNAELHPHSWNAHNSLGDAHKQNGRKQLAIAAFSRSLALNPSDATGKRELQELRGE